VTSRPRRIGVYELREVLGEGATGVVHRAVADGGRRAALKIIRADLAVDEQYCRRLVHEVRAAREIRHRHIVPGWTPARPTERCTSRSSTCRRAETLTERLRHRVPMPPTEIVELGLQVASTVDAVHEAGVVHRDITSANMILSRGDALLTDSVSPKELRRRRSPDLGAFSEARTI
jgi:serine/threonine protein kinase